MTAQQLFAPQHSDVASPTAICTHQSITPGLDRVCCKNCHREWPCWHPDYERMLNHPSIVAPEQTDIVLEQILPTVAPEQTHWVETYSPSNRKHCTYYRYMWMEGRKLRRCHIPGSSKGVSALVRKQEVERAMREGWWPTEIEELIKSWRHK